MSAVVLQVMREYADAIRGDWGSIDGRSVKGDLLAWVAALSDKPGPEAQWTLAEWRERMGVCATGGGHWTHFCDDDYCPDDEESPR